MRIANIDRATPEGVLDALEESIAASDIRAAKRRQGSRERRQELRVLPTRGCLIGNTLSPGTDVSYFINALGQRL